MLEISKHPVAGTYLAFNADSGITYEYDKRENKTVNVQCIHDNGEKFYYGDDDFPMTDSEINAIELEISKQVFGND